MAYSPMHPAFPLETPRVAAPAAAARATSRFPAIVRGALYLFILSIPFEIPRRPIPIEIPTLAGMVLLLTTLFGLRACYGRVPKAVPFFVIWLWIYGISALVNDVQHGDLVLRLFVNLVLVLLIFWVLVNALAEPRILRNVVLGLVLACIVRSALQVAGVGVTAEDLWTGGERISVFGQNSNLSAMILAAGMMLLIGVQLEKTPGLLRMRIFTWPLAGLIGFAIVQGGSRGGILGALLGLLVYAFRGRTLLQRIRTGVIAAAAIAALIYAVETSEAMRGRIRWTVEGHLAGRERIYPALVEMFTERPLLGWGPYGNQSETARRLRDRREVIDSHNLVLELLTSTGIVGAIPFLIGMGMCVRGAWRSRKGPLGIMPFALSVAVLIGTVSGTWIAAKIVWFALAFGAAAGLHWTPPRPLSRRFS